MAYYTPLRGCSACLANVVVSRSAAPARRRTFAAAFSSTSSSASDDTPSTSAKPANTGNDQKDDSGRPPPLPRPLGVPQPPRKHVKPSLKEWRERLLDQDARMQERRHLVKEATTGYFEDYNKLRHEGGKDWIAPKTLIQEKAALYFPEMEGQSLEPPSGQKDTTVHTSEMLRGKISLVVMLSTRISEAHVESYTKAILSKPEIKDDPKFQFVQINCQENKLKWILVGIFISTLRRSIPEEFRKTYVVSTENLEYLREPIGMTNKHLGYVYLVDENAKIRWAAVSFANTGQGKSPAEWDSATEVDEVEALVTCTKVLLQRLKAGSK